MLVSIGRIAARRVLAPASSKLLVTTALHPRIVDLSVRGIAASALVQSPAAKSTASSSTKAKTSARPKAKSTAKSKVNKAKAAKAKPKPAKPKPAKPIAKKKLVAKHLTPEQKQRRAIRFLRHIALTREMPKPLPRSSWNVFIGKKLHKGSVLTRDMAGLSTTFATLPEDTKKELENQATRNRHANVEKMKAWVQEHPPEAIYLANLARRRLDRKFKRAYSQIQDPRLPARPSSAFIHYYIKRRGDGTDLPSDGVINMSRQVAVEWRALAPSEKKKYEAMNQEDSERFRREFQALKPKMEEYIQAQKEVFRTRHNKSSKQAARQRK
ncbi:hypothetical protein CDD82_6828 [Ophiocordyceps australis]|uniref:HMG box domain-containing protein n=1 Tax=Ophiocordyceps australis TaxID=1399860 RepID=A0A2C5YV81_9HYPO|nr:hypothetical protein CDD82_6828 [Ophiocordyceps australis]